MKKSCWPSPQLLLLAMIEFLAVESQGGFLPARKYVSTTVESAVGRSAKLGCNMTVAKDDAVYLVLWFKQGLVPPIYSYDVREVPAGKHWYDSEVLDNRASFHPHTRSSTRISGPGAHLFLKHLKQSDGGVYKCRVDFQKAPTMITRVNLTVITPPTRVELTQQNERVATVLGPVREAANITVTCTAYDGIPTPRIEWHLDGELLRDDQNLDPNNIRAMRLKSGAQFKYSFSKSSDTSRSSREHDDGGKKNLDKRKTIKTHRKFEQTFEVRRISESFSFNHSKKGFPSKLQSVTQGWLTMYDVSRALLMTRVQCSAVNSKTLPSISTSATLDMNLSPVGIRIEQSPKDLIAGRSADISCVSWGSRPPAVLTWWSNLTRLTVPSSLVWREGNESKAILRWSLNASHDGMPLTCKASNAALPDEAPITANTVLFVRYAPLVYLRPGRNLDLLKVQEGDDVYFDCFVQSNPPVKGRIQWRHNGSTVAEAVSAGVLLTERSLVLQAVSRDQAGAYSCSAANLQGETESVPLILNIRYPPVCRNEVTVTYGVSLMEEAVITCQVDAYPPVTGFVWWFNNSADTLELPGDTERGSSFLHYTPATDLDYGTLLCLARNEVGKQQEPCTFQIIPAALPEAPTNCTLANVTSSSVSVTCLSGFDGGLPQVFVLEAYTTKPHHLFANISAKIPKFQVSGLSGETELQLIVYSGNAKGRSGGVARLVANTPELPVKQLETRLDTDAVPHSAHSLLGVLAGVGLIVILLCGVSLSVAKVQCRKRRRLQHTSTSEESLRQSDIDAACGTSSQEAPSQMAPVSKKPDSSLAQTPAPDLTCFVEIPTAKDANLVSKDINKKYLIKAASTFSIQCPLPVTSEIPLNEREFCPKNEHPGPHDSICKNVTLRMQHKRLPYDLASPTQLTGHLLVRPMDDGDSHETHRVNDFPENTNMRQFRGTSNKPVLTGILKTSPLLDSTCKCIPPAHSVAKDGSRTREVQSYHDTEIGGYSSHTLPTRSSSSAAAEAAVQTKTDCTCLQIQGAQCAHNVASTPKETLPHRSYGLAGKQQSPQKNCQSISTLEKSRLRSLSLRRPRNEDHFLNYQDDVIAPAEEFQDPQPRRCKESENSL